MRQIAARFGVDEKSVRRYKASGAIGTPSPAPVDDLSHDTDDGGEIPVIFRDYRHLDSLHVYALSDVHKGSPRHQTDRWREWVAYLTKTPGTSAILNGDLFNAAIIGAKSDTLDEALTVGDAKRELRGELTPLGREGRIDAMSPGNHEWRITRIIGDCPVRDVSEWLDAPYFRSAAMLVYLVGDQTYNVFVRHGVGNGQALAGLSKSATVADADVYVTGHTHSQACTADEFFRRDGDRMTRVRRYYVSSGSFLGYERYAAERGYKPSRIGAPRIYLSGEKHDVHVSI